MPIMGFGKPNKEFQRRSNFTGPEFLKVEAGTDYRLTLLFDETAGAFSHWSGGSSFRCLDSDEETGKCPICQLANKLLDSPDEEIVKRGKQLRAKPRFATYVVVWEVNSKQELEWDVRLWRFSETTFKNLGHKIQVWKSLKGIDLAVTRESKNKAESIEVFPPTEAWMTVYPELKEEIESYIKQKGIRIASCMYTLGKIIEDPVELLNEAELLGDYKNYIGLGNLPGGGLPAHEVSDSGDTPKPKVKIKPKPSVVEEVKEDALADDVPFDGGDVSEVDGDVEAEDEIEDDAEADGVEESPKIKIQPKINSKSEKQKKPKEKTKIKANSKIKDLLKKFN